jgi:hypothetical protein
MDELLSVIDSEDGRDSFVMVTPEGLGNDDDEDDIGRGRSRTETTGLERVREESEDRERESGIESLSGSITALPLIDNDPSQTITYSNSDSAPLVRHLNALSLGLNHGGYRRSNSSPSRSPISAERRRVRNGPVRRVITTERGGIVTKRKFLDWLEDD